MTGRRLRVVVCGTTFGQFYLAAIAALPEEFELAGILARGGERSVECARRHGVPLYAEVAQLPDDIDLACVVVRSGVMGGSGSDLAQALMARGIHVVQEQPVHHDDLAACLRTARRHGVRYRLGDLYVRLPAVRWFAAAARALLNRQHAVYVDAACSMQVAFPLVHLLGDALGGVRPWRLDPAGGQDAPFTVLAGEVSGVPLTLRVHNQVDPADPDNHIHLLHRVTIGTDGGALTLTDTHGPVTWIPRLHIPDAVKHRFDMTGPGTGHLGEPSTVVLGPAQPPAYRRILGELWPAAIGADLLAQRAAILGLPGAERPEQYHLALCRLWQDVTAAAGYPSLRPAQTHRPLPVAELIAAVADIEDETVAGSDNAGDPIDAAAQAAERTAHGITAEGTRTFVERLDEAVLSSVALAFQRCGLLEPSGPGRPAAEILAAARTAPQHHALVERWLGILAEHGLARRESERFLAAGPIEETAVARSWELAADAWTGGLGSAAFIDYLRANAEHLPELMSGEQHPALLLFPEGRTDLADAVYRETATARYLNAAVAEAVRRIAEAAPRPLRILEVGAGTGATTDAVLAQLTEADYLFTDLSQFFLAPARERFAGRPGLRFAVFDIDRPAAAQGLAPDSFDVVIAAGVLNNACDADATVRELVKLLAPGGRLLITEPTREHLEILASQAFMMTPPQDARRESGTTFLSRAQWSDVLTGAGLGDVRTLPAEDHPLAPLGQRLFAARKEGGPC
ncbi:hypothetical protein GCM10010441_27500 [Kitasatospora paracochleata]|uniref:Thiazolinyl imide reductase n=1 Tax=Kitasatospora paracochleata TaxID=58354 RepID=A0ABT1IWE5_9ACTN|nr:bifunctional Gfo/Idh/MocA family oxidoreductase/class I SAM-dependent methyltransferase [Kitasatospora paracochleata]MCP2309468.1 thiazolinyl imide reductase [Kitasatospora paracochleata]